MATLLDTIQQNRQALGATQAPITDQTQTVQNLLRAKTGKAVTPGGGDVAQSNIGEQAAVANTQSQLGALQPQIEMESQKTGLQAQGQQQQQQQQEQQVAQSRRFNTVENKMKTDQLLQGLSQEKGTLDVEKDKAKLEQTAFLLSMQDKSYVDTLNDIGRRRRLDSDVGMKEEMQNMAFGSNVALLKQKLGQDDILQADNRDYQKALASMTVDDAVKVAAMEAQNAERTSALNQQLIVTGAQMAAKTANIQGQAQGINSLVQGTTKGVAAYGDIKAKQPTTTTTPPEQFSNDDSSRFSGV